MAISFSRYINITSGVGGTGAVKARDLITRIFTTNPLVPAGGFLEFTSAAAVATYFGSQSEEYLRAAFYFGFVSKNITAPDKISFGRWVNAAVAPSASGDPAHTDTLAQFNAITAGKLTITLDGATATTSAIDLSAAGSLAAVATTVQTAIRGLTGAPFAAATVSYNASKGNFIISTSATGTAAGTFSFNNDPSNTVSTALGMLAAGTVISPGADIETITQTLTNSANASTNFASFLFTDTAALNQAQTVEAATWNDDNNIDYMFLVPVTAADAAAYSTALMGLAGQAMTLAPLVAEYPEMCPGMIMAATDYTRRNASQNYMFQQFTLTPSVITDADANTYDAIRVNYYGQTQTAGQPINFYQRGLLTGLATDPSDQNVYANEIWFKATVADNLMSLFLALSEVPANSQGRAILLAILQATIEQATFNGVISVGKTLTPTQIAFITQITGDQKAYAQVQSIGYWLDVSFSSTVTVDNRTEYQANYILVYGKDDAIRKVVGSHILI